MKTLFENRLAPLTYSIGFLECPLDRVVTESSAWQKTTFSAVDVAAVESPLSDGLMHLEPLTTLPRRRLLVRTDSQWTACFDNGHKGGDPSSFVGYMSERLKCRGLAVTCIPHKPGRGPTQQAGSADAIRFVLYAPEKRDWLNIERSISVVNDYGDWTFKATGTVQPFETPERYQARAVRDRFTADMLEEYCAALNIRLFDDSFYGPSGFVIRIDDPLPPSVAAMSLAEAQARLDSRR